MFRQREERMTRGWGEGRSRLTLALGVLGALGALVTWTHSAQAFEYPSGACWTVSNKWNVPNGGLVLSRQNSPIGRVLKKGGEMRSHSAISHGNGWLTHSSMMSPSTKGWPSVCSGGPAKSSELREGAPGASQINNGAAYGYYYLDPYPLEYIAYQMAWSGSSIDYDAATKTATWLWLYSEWVYQPYWEFNVYGATLMAGGGNYLIYYNGAPQPYVFYQYRNIDSRHVGKGSYENGLVCSTSLAWGLSNADKHYSGAWRNMSAHGYTHAQLVDMGNELYRAGVAACDEGYMNEIAAVSCLESICDDFGRQLRNCMMAHECGTDSSSIWNNIKNNSYAVAYTISPSKLGGWDGHPYGWEGSSLGYGPWSYYWDSPVQWNSSGSVYGCWM